MGLDPRLALESGWNHELTEEFERLRVMIGWDRDRQAYGYGGFLVKPEWPHFGRDDVAANFKLCRTGRTAVMKFGDEPGAGKQSLPGDPVILRPHPLEARPGMPAGYVAQEGEDFEPPVECIRLSGAQKVGDLSPVPGAKPIALSPATQALVVECSARRQAIITRAKLRDMEGR